MKYKRLRLYIVALMICIVCLVFFIYNVWRLFIKPEPEEETNTEESVVSETEDMTRADSNLLFVNNRECYVLVFDDKKNEQASY